MLEAPKAFQPDAFGVVFFSRGRGRGHAVPDMAIDRELRRTPSNLEIRFVSYSGGAHAFRSCGYEVVDLQMPDDPQVLESIIVQTQVVGCLRPRLVVTHEEFPALVAARVFGVPCILITDFFQDPNTIFMRAMEYASEIVFTAEPRIYTEPPFLGSPVQYVGPAVRKFDYGRGDRDRARQELGVPSDATVVLCQPGNWPEAQVPMAQLLAGAWDALPYGSKRLIWLAGRDHDLLRSRFDGRTDIRIIKEDWQIDRLFVASDLVITKANRLTVYEAASLGIPSISISNGANWPDDVAVARVRSNSTLHVRALTSEGLARLLIERIAGGWAAQETLPKWDGVARAAGRIAAQIERIRCGGMRETGSI